MCVDYCYLFFLFSSRRRHTRCALVTGVQTCALTIYSVAFIGYDFTGATVKAQVRDRKDGGFVRADMTVTLASVTTDEGVPTSTVDLEIPEATMEAMDAATEAGDDAKIWWDLHITPSGGEIGRAHV